MVTTCANEENMNRIILIGNGFDLAHSLETSYRSFIDKLWKDKIQHLKESAYNKDDDLDLDEKDRKTLIRNGDLIKTYNELIDFNHNYKDEKIRLNIKNKFLELISQKDYLLNWVDVENEYFNDLLIVSKNINEDSEIKKLNCDFLAIKNLLEKYITDEIKRKKDSLKRKDEIYSIIYSNFYIEDFSKVGLDYLYKEIFAELNSMFDKSKSPGDFNEHLCVYEHVLSKDKDKNYFLNEDKLKKLFQNHDLSKQFVDLKPSAYLFLNFNYTNIESNYSKYERSVYTSNYLPKVDINHIHGELNNKSNPIIFGYGDEIGKDYKIIEELNNNNLLENVKSIRYLDTDKYKKLLEYIDSDKYQIFIMGHSCGNSDRTLLNTLFEHKNCVSIKVFYHQINENDDNYSDVIRNISRNFNDKKMMREKVVNKRYCSPLIKK